MSAFTKVPSIKPGRSVFNLSYQKQFDCDFGELIPVTLEEMVPGDTFKFGNEIVVRMHPLNAPVLAEVNAYVHYFFVPTRLIWDGWEDFITGGEFDPNNGDEYGLDPTPLPRLGDHNLVNKAGLQLSAAQAIGLHSLYDYFGFPVIYKNNQYRFPGEGEASNTPGHFLKPLEFPWRIYSLVWNEYYRDETLQSEVSPYIGEVLHRNWQKDYFTSALPWQQKGISPALPISGEFPAYLSGSSSEIPKRYLYSDADTLEDHSSIHWNNTNNPLAISIHGKKVMVNIADAATFDVSDLRLAFQVQRWMERNAISGSRYTEFLHAHYGVSPRDERLQRPEYLGGSKSPILVSEVVQTSESGTTPQGTLKGKGITADRNFVASYTAKEFGYIIGLLSIMPKPGYFQGVDRKWLRNSRFDFFSPEFGRLSEQAVTTEEVYALPGNTDESGIYNSTIFGYQARFNEMRQNHDVFCGELRPNASLGYWNLGRYFDTVPQLNNDFITLDASNDHLKRIFAVQNVKGMIVNFANIITAIRPIPKYGEPGLIDHV